MKRYQRITQMLLEGIVFILLIVAGVYLAVHRPDVSDYKHRAFDLARCPIYRELKVMRPEEKTEALLSLGVKIPEGLLKDESVAVRCVQMVFDDLARGAIVAGEIPYGRVELWDLVREIRALLVRSYLEDRTFLWIKVKDWRMIGSGAAFLLACGMVVRWGYKKKTAPTE